MNIGHHEEANFCDNLVTILGTFESCRAHQRNQTFKAATMAALNV
jgi:hypothetical protein